MGGRWPRSFGFRFDGDSAGNLFAAVLLLILGRENWKENILGKFKGERFFWKFRFDCYLILTNGPKSDFDCY